MSDDVIPDFGDVEVQAYEGSPGSEKGGRIWLWTYEGETAYLTREEALALASYLLETAITLPESFWEPKPAEPKRPPPPPPSPPEPEEWTIQFRYRNVEESWHPIGDVYPTLTIAQAAARAMKLTDPEMVRFVKLPTRVKREMWEIQQYHQSANRWIGLQTHQGEKMQYDTIENAVRDFFARNIPAHSSMFRIEKIIA